MGPLSTNSGAISESLSTCHCCEGVTQETPQALYNRPGLAAIAYRVGTHDQFKATLLARLYTSGQMALRGLRSRADDDFTIALLDALATVGDVLTFYSERIANEAYLRTAVERRSVLELAALIGYQLRPGVAASTWLAFTIDDAPGATGTTLTPPTIAAVMPEAPQTVTIDIGAKVQSVPGPGEQPQVYETVEKILARAEWNSMLPRPVQPQIVSIHARSFLLAGAITNLKAGDRILVNGQEGQEVRTIQKVTVAADAKTTQIDVNKNPGLLPAHYTRPSPPTGSINDFPARTPLTTSVVQQILAKSWDASDLVALAQVQKWPLDQLSADIALQVAQLRQSGGVFAFRQRAAVFGYNAPLWSSLPPSLRYDSIFKGATTDITVPAAYPADWDNLTLEARAAPIGNQRSVFLDNSYPAVLAGSWIVLQAPGGRRGDHRFIAPVVSNTEVAHSDFTLSGKVSELRIIAQGALSAFLIRRTTVLCQSEPLALAQVPVTDDVGGDTIVLDHGYLGLIAGQKVVIAGERRDLDGVTVAEIRTLRKVILEQGFTVIMLDSSLDHIYKRASVRINANVAQSTNGETMPVEVLGSGDGTQEFQTFALRQPPLTYVSVDSPSGIKSTLEIRVDDMLWKEVPFFFSHGPEEHIYILRKDDAGVTTVIFGDGKTGSRLPTGQQNVKAKYRKGIGTKGLVRANQLSQVTQRPLGVRGANNPLAPTGAADPERLEDARRNATLTIMTLDRVVSLEDYQDFARAFAGIGKALATWSWDGEQRIVLLTVAGANGAAVPPGSQFYKSLQNALGNSSEPRVKLGLYSYQPIFFRVGGVVTADPDYLIDDVSAAVENALRATFSFDARAFGQPVHRSEVIATIQNVPGVVDVDLTQFYRSDDSSPSLQDDIVAAVPGPADATFFGAELVTLDARPLDLKVTQ
jgi:predicted phage baseplate assembly protein